MPKAAHGTGYYCLGCFVLYALPARRRGSPPIALVMRRLSAITGEIHQAYVPGRTASAMGILLDTQAALAGVAVMLRVSRPTQGHQP